MSKKKMSVEEIKFEYNELTEKLTRLKDEIFRTITKLIKEEDIKLGFDIIGRVKELDSVIKKHESGLINLKKTITELQDLVGFRIILLFSRDVDKVVTLIENRLKLLKKYDTLDRLEDDQFGYSSIHCVVTIPNSWLQVPMYEDLEDLKIEIQIRTLSQHTWAASSHLIDYKNSSDLAKPMKRSISRISALLEIVDFEFERLLSEKSEFQENKERQESEDFLNEKNLIEILNKKLPLKNKRGDEEYSEILENLEKINIFSKQKLIDIINEDIKEALEFESHICNKIIQNQDDEEYIVFDETRYLKVNIEKTEHGYAFYNQVGLLALIFKIRKLRLQKK